MHAPAQKPEIAAVPDPAVDELNRIVEQAEALLRSLGSETGDAADAMRERVSHTLHQAKSRLETTADQASEVVETLAERADGYVRTNPWQSVALAALLGGVAGWLLSRSRG